LITVLNRLKQKFRTWASRQKIESGTITLTQRRIYIIPSKQGFALATVLGLMLVGDINYSLSLGYVLTFLLAMTALMSMLHTFRNLAHLEIRAGHAEAVFGGDTARFLLYFNNKSKLPRYQLCLRNAEGLKICFDILPLQDNPIVFTVPATRRGWLPPGRLTLYTEFPLGLFYCWTYLHFDTRCLVYPKPLSEAPLPPGDAPDGAGKRTIVGDDDFSGLRKYAVGDALPRIAWKAFARGQGLQVKQFSTQVGDELWLDLAAATDLNTESKLSRMTRWVLDAESQGMHYGLRLPDGELPVGSGMAHRNKCLQHITLFGLDDKSP
jgi:uncharacterized protein (DUF58 family)